MLDRLRRIFRVAFGEAVVADTDPDELFDIATGYVTLGADGYRSTGAAAVCVGTVDTAKFASILEDIDALLDIDTPSPDSRIQKDDSGYTWVLFEQDDFETLVTEVYSIVETLLDAGAGEYLLAAVFAFEADSRAYWIYNFKRGQWYPFVPTGNYDRDSETEAHLREILEAELDLEPRSDREYPFWELPI